MALHLPKDKRRKALLLTTLFVMGFFVPYHYDNEKAVEYAIAKSGEKSRCMCAWYVTKALHQGGCLWCGIYPAYAYEDRLALLGFEEVPQEECKRGDIAILSSNSKSVFGHVAIFDGKNWHSDFKQKGIYPSATYRSESKCKVFRQSDGWHTASIWIAPISLAKYAYTLIKGFHRIKL